MMSTSPFVTMFDGSVIQRAVPKESPKDQAKRQASAREATRLALENRLTDYKKAVNDHEVAKAAMATAKTALDDASLSEDQVLLKGHAFKRAKVDCEEREIEVCKALEQVNFDSIAPFNREYTGLYDSTYDALRDQLRIDVIAAARWRATAHNRHALEAVDTVIQMSDEMISLRDLAPKPLSPTGPPRWETQDPSMYWVQFAQDLLSKHDRLMQLKEAK